jgi:hypothetical protein
MRSNDLFGDIAVIKLEKEHPGAVPATPARRSHSLQALVLASIGYNSNPNITASRRLYDVDVASKELRQKAVQLAPEKISAATTTYSIYGEQCSWWTNQRAKSGGI